MRVRKISVRRHGDTNRPRRWAVYFRGANDKKKSAFFATKGEAEVYAELKRAEVRNFGLQALNMPEAVRHEALQAIELLKPSGRSLLEAVRFYNEHLRRNAPTCTLSELVEKFLTSKEIDPISPRHFGDLRVRTRCFAEALGPKMVNEIEPFDITNWLHSQGVGPQSQKNFRQVLHNLFGYAKRNKYVQENPVAGTPKIRVPDKEVEIYTPEEMARLLVVADPVIIPYLTLGAFAGLRSAEAMRLHWQHVDLANGVIRIGGDIAKTGSKRIIPIADNLRSWLMPYAGQTGKVLPDKYCNTFREKMQDACKQATVTFKGNALRHSFASYRLAQIQDVPKTAFEMGNSTQIIQKHYRQLVTAVEAAAYWNILSPLVGTNIILMTASPERLHYPSAVTLAAAY
jgi:integrase